jgi:MSHA biogenesis protein MshO
MRLTHPDRHAGFTLVEMVMVMVLIGVLAGLGSQMVKPAVDAYTATIKRAGLAENADLIARRLERDLHAALPNSIRATSDGFALEFVPVVGGGLYRSSSRSGGGGDVLRFDIADTSFDVLGPIPVYTSSQFLVITNLGTGSGSDAYSGGNRAAITVANTGDTFSTDSVPLVVSFASKQFPVPSPASRFHIVDSPVSYVCDMTTKTLKRYQGYGWNSSQLALPPPGGTSATVSSMISACALKYSPGISSRTGLATVSLMLTNAASESMDILVQVNVPNEP